MSEILLRHYQKEAIDAVQKALNNGRKHIAVEMATGCGKTIVLVKIVESIKNFNDGKILVITNRIALKEQIIDALFKHCKDFAMFYKNDIHVETLQKTLKYPHEKLHDYKYLVLFDMNLFEKDYHSLDYENKTIIEVIPNNKLKINKLTPSPDVVFSYSYNDAVNDGFLTPAMDLRALGPAVESFGKQMLEQFGYTQFIPDEYNKDLSYDLMVQKADQKIYVEFKTYKSQVLSPTAANTLLSDVVMQKTRANHSDIILLMVFSSIPTFQKDEIFRRYNIIVWDIENLVFYSKNNPALLKKLSSITYFPINYIEGTISEEAESIELSLISEKDEITSEAEKEFSETIELIDLLNSCKSGKKYSAEYEEICEKILRYLFETNYFNRLTSQHKTKDEHFRMDLIGSLKINQSNDESMHPLLQMLVHHYNSHFIVFEFKNYSKQIDQNLIYITEKYLFNAALRNVAIIISRKGFSKSAQFAANGCLKEHGKIILDINDEDLIKMLEMKSDKAADYLLGKLEEFLMSISK